MFHLEFRLALTAILVLCGALVGQGRQATWSDSERDPLSFASFEPSLEWSNTARKIEEDRLIGGDLSTLIQFDDLASFPKSWEQFASYKSHQTGGDFHNQYHLSVANADGTGPVRMVSVHGWAYARIVTTMSVVPDDSNSGLPWWRLRQTFVGWPGHDSAGNDEKNQANHPVNFYTPKNDFWGSVEEEIGPERVTIRLATQATNFYREGSGPTLREYRRTSVLITAEKGGRIVVVLPRQGTLDSPIRTYLFGKPGGFEEETLEANELKNPYKPFSRIVPMVNSRTGVMPFEAIYFPFDMTIGNNWRPINGKRPPARPVAENGTQYRYTIGTYLHLRPTKTPKAPTGDVVARNPKDGTRYDYNVWLSTPWGLEVNLSDLDDAPPGLFGEGEIVTMMLRDGMPPHPGFMGSKNDGFVPFSLKTPKELRLAANDLVGR